MSLHEETLPDYCNSLDAIAKAEVMLSYAQITQMMLFLHEIMPDNLPSFRATAAQRCEALLRTIGKWIEDSALDSLK